MPHIHEKIDFGADVYVVNQDAVLLRFHEKYHFWCAPGGHIELNEDPEEAAVREVKEETGLDVVLVGERAPEFNDGDREVLPPRFVNRHRINETHEHVVFKYFATAATRNLQPAIGEKETDMRWFTRDELDDPKYDIRERVRSYATAALDELASPKNPG